MSTRKPGITLATLHALVAALTVVAIATGIWAKLATGSNASISIGLLRSTGTMIIGGVVSGTDGSNNDLCLGFKAVYDDLVNARAEMNFQNMALAQKDRCDRAVACAKAAFAMHFVAIFFNLAAGAGYAYCAAISHRRTDARGMWACFAAFSVLGFLFHVVAIIIYGAGFHASIKELNNGTPADIGYSAGIGIAAVCLDFITIFLCWSLFKTARQFPDMEKEQDAEAGKLMGANSKSPKGEAAKSPKGKDKDAAKGKETKDTKKGKKDPPAPPITSNIKDQTEFVSIETAMPPPKRK